MREAFILIAGLSGAALPVLAQSPAVLEPGLVQMAERTGGPEGEAVILFAAGPGGQVGGDVLSSDGTLLCEAAWTAEAVEAGPALSFDRVTLSPAPCLAEEALRDFAARLARVVASVATEEGTELRDAQGQTLLRLKVAG